MCLCVTSLAVLEWYSLFILLTIVLFHRISLGFAWEERA